MTGVGNNSKKENAILQNAKQKLKNKSIKSKQQKICIYKNKTSFVDLLNILQHCNLSYISLNCIIFGQQPSVSFLPQRYTSRQHYVGRVLHFMFKNFTQMETQLCLNIKHFYIYIDTMPATFCECYNSCGCIFRCTQLEKNKR